MSQTPKKEVDHETILRLGRTFRRIQRTMKESMRVLGLEEDEVILRRKKRRAAKPAPKKESKAA